MVDTGHFIGNVSTNRLNMPHYWKEQISNQLFVNGKSPSWTQLSGNAGYLTVEAGSELDVALSKIVGKMGVTKLTDEELSKKKQSRLLAPSPLNRFGKKWLAVAGKKPKTDSTPKAELLFPPSAPAASVEADVPKAPAAPKLGKLKPVEATA